MKGINREKAEAALRKAGVKPGIGRYVILLAIFNILLTLAMLLSGVIVAEASRISYQRGPHAFMNERDSCRSCHDLYLGEVDPHEFTVPVTEICRNCHRGEGFSSGRSHPVDIKPVCSKYEFKISEELPLDEEKVSCGSCHNPHSQWASMDESYAVREPAFIIQDGEEEIEYFKTYYLRITDPENGNETLCLGCHQR